MLVLSRKVGEQVIIGGGIRVTVVAVQGSQVRLGFTAPDHVRIHRQELGLSATIASSGGQCLEDELTDPVI